MTSGSQSDPIALDEGANPITVRVTAESGTTKDYTVTVTRQDATGGTTKDGGPTPSSNANLSGLTATSSTSAAGDFTALALTPSTFSAATTSYTASVDNTITHVKLTPTVQDTGKATVAVGGTTVTSGSQSDPIALSVGANPITVQVTAESGTTKDYTVTVTRQAPTGDTPPDSGPTQSSNANLSGLTATSSTSASGAFTALTLTPSTFSAATTSYTASVDNAITHVKLTPTVQDTGKATVAVGGTTVTSGSQSDPIALDEGANPITVRVTAESGTTKDYTVTVTRQAPTGGDTPPGGGSTPSSNANLSGLTATSSTSAAGDFTTLALTPSTFSAATTSYTAAVANAITHVKLTPTVQDTGKATVAVGGTTVTSGSPSGSIPLSVGENPIEVVVTAEDGTTRTYRVTVTRGEKVLGAAEKAHVDRVGKALLGLVDPGVSAPEGASDR